MNPFVLSLIRHGLSGLGVLLVNKGLADQGSVDGFINSSAEIVSGVVSAGIAILWSRAVHLKSK
jgi:hypothetical protein